MKHLKALILVVLMLLCISSIASADAIAPRDSNYFSGYGISLSTTGSGDFTFTMSCSSVGVASQLGVSTYSVQKSTDSGWVTVSGPNDGSYAYNTSSFAMSKSFNGIAGEKYRVTCTFLCTKNNTTETKSYTSRTVTAK